MCAYLVSTTNERDTHQTESVDCLLDEECDFIHLLRVAYWKTQAVHLVATCHLKPKHVGNRYTQCIGWDGGNELALPDHVKKVGTVAAVRALRRAE